MYLPYNTIDCKFIYSPQQHISFALNTFLFSPQTWLMVTGGWQLLTTVCICCCHASGHLEYGCVCVCVCVCVTTGIVLNRSAHVPVVLLWTGAHPVYLKWRAFHQSAWVCACGECLYLNVYIYMDVCVSFIPILMLLYTHSILLNGIIYLHSHYKCYYILAFSLSMP